MTLTIKDKPFKLVGTDKSIFSDVTGRLYVYLRHEKFFVPPSERAFEDVEEKKRVYLSPEQIKQVNETYDYKLEENAE